MDFIQIITLFFANAGLILWMRAESRADWRMMDAKINAMHQDTDAKIDAIHAEIKDFHGRLCAIEERRRRD